MSVRVLANHLDMVFVYYFIVNNKLQYERDYIMVERSRIWRYVAAARVSLST